METRIFRVCLVRKSGNRPISIDRALTKEVLLQDLLLTPFSSVRYELINYIGCFQVFT